MWHRPDRILRQFGMEQPIPPYRDAGRRSDDPSVHDSTVGVAGARDDGAVYSTVEVARLPRSRGRYSWRSGALAFP
ncbi:hypothetical protein LINGRAHAP2_LOCUS15859 [Linum grandiflorum]